MNRAVLAWLHEMFGDPFPVWLWIVLLGCLVFVLASALNARGRRRR